MSAASFDAFCTMLPRLQAEERLAYITDTAAGAGTMKNASGHIASLRRVMNRGRKPQKGGATAIASMGIGVKRG